MPSFESAGIWITVGIVVVVILFLILLCWKRVPADKAMVITGLKKRVLVGLRKLLPSREFSSISPVRRLSRLTIIRI